MQRLSSSWRDRPLDVTRRIAERLAPTLGITRITEITWLDRIGIPVFASIRPGAAEGSLCVNAGKGSTRDEARIGALMEAVEFAMAEPEQHRRVIFVASPMEIVQQASLAVEFVDFCPLWQVVIDPTARIDAIYATDIANLNAVAIPAELVFSPYQAMGRQVLFGHSTNGLCSGNNINEALLHGLCEVLERDVLSFNNVQDKSVWVEQSELPVCISELLDKITRAGMRVALRYTKNVFGLPFFQGYIFSANDDVIAISVGSGLHPSRKIAAVRAITEAAQSRLSYIHGGRDDLTERKEFFAIRGPEVERRELRTMRERALAKRPAITFADIEEASCASVEDGLNLLRARLQLVGIQQVLYVDLSPNAELAVLKVIVPQLESFSRHSMRVGKRLVRYIEDVA